ncbi:MarR family winged helix-turn-helix transcriptional regulator [Rhizobium leguminosarum]|uniref:MarR family winged helix-turn-helix transcriptional regulator n=1 Tax=Rhizobium leguminosarum TaxID=384 RepID=UPI0003770CFC|nr:MarR family transcriptional regulator [Rhizobium leguminosarum]MBW8786292.1 MarR family transcriptional regulator [Rhizobium leguminosarum]
MPSASDRHAKAAASAWRMMFDLLMKSAPQRLESLQARGLTPNDSRALFTLHDEGEPISALARQWGCDASTATWLVDRLERAGLAERVTPEHDRRVKLVQLTGKGAATKDELLVEHYRPPVELRHLSVGELEELARLLAKTEGGH